MEYTINQLAKLAGITTKTLRYYDQIDLLKPAKLNSNGYRIYTKDEVNKLYDILTLKELGIKLDDMKPLLNSNLPSSVEPLKKHRENLMEQKKQLDILIDFVDEKISFSEFLDDAAKRLANLGEEELKAEELRLEKSKKEQEMQTMQRKLELEKKLEEKPHLKHSKSLSILDRLNLLIPSDNIEEFTKYMTPLFTDYIPLIDTLEPSSDDAMEICRLHKKVIKSLNLDDSKENILSLCHKYVHDINYYVYFIMFKEGIAEFLYEATKIYYKKYPHEE